MEWGEKQFNSKFYLIKNDSSLCSGHRLSTDYLLPPAIIFISRVCRYIQ
jgi:hypothetical protein